MMLTVPLFFLLFIISVAAKDEQSYLIPLHSIIPQQYELILNLTDIRPITSEGRVIVSGLAAITGLATGFTAGVATSVLPRILSRLVDVNRNQLQQRMNMKTTHPLCIIDSNVNEIHKELTSSIDSSKVNCAIVIQSGRIGILDQMNSSKDSMYKPVKNFSPNTYFNGLQWYYPYYSNSYYSQSAPISTFDPYTKYRKSKQLGMEKNSVEDHGAIDDMDNSDNQNYAKILNFPIEGYKTVKYPQTPYQSNYPKLIYTHAISGSVPVYIKTIYEGNSNAADNNRNNMFNN